MKTLSTFFLILSFSLTSLAGKHSDEPFKKTWNKSYLANVSSILNIKNKYGDITFHASGGNTITVDVTITVDKNSDKAAEKLLESIEIVESVSGNEIAIKTTFSKNMNVGNSDLSVNYVVSVPKYVALQISNAFGNMAIGEQLGNVVFNQEYGTLKAGSLKGSKNDITVKFGNADIAFFEKGKITLAYSNLELEKAAILELKSSFSNLEIETVQSLELTSEYDNLELGEIENLKLDAKFTNTEIESITKNCNVNAQFGEVEIENVSRDFEAVEVNSQFGSVEVEMEENASYQFDCKVEFGSLNLPSNATVNKDVKDINLKHKGGSIGKTPNEKSVAIYVKNASIKLK